MGDLFVSEERLARDLKRKFSTMTSAQKFQPHPLLVALVELGVTKATLAQITGTQPTYWSNLLAGRQAVPEKYLPLLADMLDRVIVLAEQGAVRAGQDPRYPQESVAGYRERISAAREALEYWRKRHAA